MKKYLLILTAVFLPVSVFSQIWEEGGHKVFTNDLYYVPAIYSHPLFTRKNEFIANLFTVTSYGFNGAYALTNHINFCAGYSVSPRDARRVNNLDFGAGYFNYIGKKGKFPYEFSVIAGRGYGKIVLDSDHQKKEKLNYNRISLQGAIGKRGKHIELAISSRFTVLEFTDYKKQYEGDDHRWLYGKYYNNRRAQIIESSFIFRGGGERVKGGIQVIIPAFLTSPIKNVKIQDSFTFLSELTFRWGFWKGYHVRKQQ